MKYNFIEIGTSDFETIMETEVIGNGISIEPLKFYLDSLPSKDNVIKVNCAISNKDGEVDIFWIQPIDIEQYNLPDWLKGCNSIINPHPSTLKELQDRKLEHIYQKSKCKTLTWSSLVEIYDIQSVDLLKIDTEGHDCYIINDILNSKKVLPKKITFENNVLTDPTLIQSTLLNLSENGYKIINTKDYDITVEKYEN